MTTELCPDCGRPRSLLCDNVLGDDRCAELAIARLRAELASARELSEAERAVVDAAIGEEINGVLASNSKDPFLRERFRKTAIQSGHALGRAVRQVLALRAKKAGE